VRKRSSSVYIDLRDKLLRLASRRAVCLGEDSARLARRLAAAKSPRLSIGSVSGPLAGGYPVLGGTSNANHGVCFRAISCHGATFCRPASTVSHRRGAVECRHAIGLASRQIRHRCELAELALSGNWCLLPGRTSRKMPRRSLGPHMGGVEPKSIRSRFPASSRRRKTTAAASEWRWL
jgi:hypothetical protein